MSLRPIAPAFFLRPFVPFPPGSSGATDALGINVHFFRPGDGFPLVTEQDLDMIRLAGFRRVRLDLLWSEVEKRPGVFDFRRYDWAIHGLLRRGIRPMVILGLGNPLYARGLTLRPPGVQEAFERYAIETVNRYRGLGLIYELVNEPNHELFWKPKPDATEYMALARRLLPRLKALDPTAFLAAPSTAGAPLDFLETCFQQGLLSLVDGVTIHPYQAFHKTSPVNRPPETFEAEYRQARALIDRYLNQSGPAGKPMPILLGEWGYSSAAGEIDERTQADYLVRQALLGILYGAPVNIWYDWKGDIQGRVDPVGKEHNFGIVSQSLYPKPAYHAMQELARHLAGQRFVGQRPAPPGDYLLQFSDGRVSTLVVWTVHAPHRITLDGIPVQVSGRPIYVRL